MSGVYVAGIGLHPFGRFPECGLKDLAAVAVRAAVSDAGISLKEIQAAWVGNAYAGLLTGQESVRGQVVLSYMGIGGIPIVNVENACASGSTGVKAAVTAIKAGECDIALVVGVEKMFVGDTGRTVKVIATSADTEVLGGTGFQFTAGYAIRARQYMKRYGATPADLARVAFKNRRNACLNPNAHFRAEVSAEDILRARSICDPLTLYMCSAISDGAAAVILVGEGVARRIGRSRLIRVASSQLRSGEPGGHSGDEQGAVWITAQQSYRESGLGPGDLQLLEVHDAAASAEWDHLEDLGICPRGESYLAISRGQMDLRGRTAVNPSGGLIGRGHPVAATGIAQIAEVVVQLRGEAGSRSVGDGTRTPVAGLCLNTGGRILDDKAAVTVHILTR